MSHKNYLYSRPVIALCTTFMLMLGCAESSVTSNVSKKGDSCPSDDYTECDGNIRLFCSTTTNKVASLTCDDGCKDGECIIPELPTGNEGDECPSTDYSKCSGNDRLYCLATTNKVAKETCKNGCTGGKCAETVDTEPDDDDDLDDYTNEPGTPCATMAYAKCDKNVRYYCDKATGLVATEECDQACDPKTLQCVKYEDNSCAKPYELTLGLLVSGNTMTGNSYQTGACSSKGMNAMMAVTHINIPTAGFYSVSTAASGASGWGTMLATECDPSTSVVNSCGIEGGSDYYYAFLESGDHYLFVAPHVTFSPHFNFTASIAKIDEKTVGLCSYSKYNYHIVNFHAAADGLQQNETIDNSTPGTYIYTIADSTKDGNTSDVWSGNSSKLSCKVLSPTAGGKDRSYLVHIPENSTFTAQLEYTFSAEKSNEAAIYMKRCDDKTNYSKVMSTLYACDDSKGDNAVMFSSDLEEGDYVLVVDTENSNSYIDYTLKLTLKQK